MDEWYAPRAPQVTSGQIQTQITKHGYQALVSPDSLSAFIARGEVVYELRYDIGVRIDAQFMQTFAMMLHSFLFTTEPLYVPQEQQLNVEELVSEVLEDDGVVEDFDMDLFSTDALEDGEVNEKTLQEESVVSEEESAINTTDDGAIDDEEINELSSSDETAQ